MCGLASPSAAVLPLPVAQYDGDEGVRSGVLNAIWAGMIIVGICFAMVHPERGMEHITHAVFRASEQAVAVALGLIGLLAFWSGIMRVAEEAGFTRLIARLLAPLVRRLFPSVPPDHPAMGSMLMALSANMLGLGNAATPLGLRAMRDLRDLDPHGDEATDAMCTFLALSTAGVTIIPSTVIALRAAQGSSDPTAIVGPTLVATMLSTVIAVVLDRLYRGGRR